MDAGIYEIRNTVNGKRYIGSSVRIKKRWRDHRSALNGRKHENQRLQRAWNKYGADAFRFSVLLHCDPGMCLEYEQRIIDAFDAVADGYNINPLAAIPPNATGRLVSNETRQRVSRARLGMKFSSEHIENMRRAHTGLKASAETRRKMSEQRKGVSHSKAWCEAISSAKKGKPGKSPSPEHRAKIGLANRGKTRTPEQRLKYSIARRRTVEAKRKAKWLLELAAVSATNSDANNAPSEMPDAIIGGHAATFVVTA